MWGQIGRQIDDRIGVSRLLAAFLERKVPRKIGWAYTLGSATTTCFMLMVLTGMLLTTHYQPAPDAAYSSVKYLKDHVLFGGFIHSLHHWGATAMVVLVALHMTRVFYWGAYKYPREMTWMSGAILLLLTLAFAFTGYLLPWDQKAYWTTVLLANMAHDAPLVGEWARILIQGGHELGAYTLTRFYSFHVILLPVLTAGIVGAHIFLVLRQGISSPPRRAEEPYADAVDHARAYQEFYAAQKAEGKPFYRSLTEDAIVSLVLVVALFLTAIIWPAPLDEPANPVGAGYAPRPEWYFLWLFQLLRYFPGPWEPVGVVGVPLVLVVVLLGVPLLDRGPRRHFAARPITITTWTVAGLAILWLTFAGAKEGSLTEGQAAGPTPSLKLSTLAAQGAKVFEAQGCISCHIVAGRGNPVGPELTQVASRRDPQFLRKWVRDAKSLKPGVAMPSYTHIPSAEYDALIQYLAELK